MSFTMFDHPRTLILKRSISVDIYTILQSKPHNPHYLNRYWNFIQYCQSQEADNNYCESHHICPKAIDLFPEFKSFILFPQNEIRLSLRQHYISHLLLWKVYGGSQLYAFNLMCSRTRKTNSKHYEISKQIFVNKMIDSNPNDTGLHSKQAWANASPERRTAQALRTEAASLSHIKPKEFREYECTNCRDTFYKLEFTHHHRQLLPFCCQPCAASFTGKLRPSKSSIQKSVSTRSAKKMIG